MGRISHDSKKHVAQPTLTRRSLVGGALVGGMLTLAGCSWTPRNAQTSQSAEPDASSQENSAATQAGSTSPADVNDDLVLVSGGTFTMGSPTDEPWRGDDEVAHETTVSDFYLAPMEVSQQEYNATMGGSGDIGNTPATDVTWYDAIAYCNALSVTAGLSPRICNRRREHDLGSFGKRLPPAHRGRVGVRLPRRHNRSVQPRPFPQRRRGQLLRSLPLRNRGQLL